MWLSTAATTTHGNCRFIRQCVCGQQTANFLSRFGLRDRTELCPVGESDFAAGNPKILLGNVRARRLRSGAARHSKTGYLGREMRPKSGDEGAGSGGRSAKKLRIGKLGTDRPPRSISLGKQAVTLS